MATLHRHLGVYLLNVSIDFADIAMIILWMKRFSIITVSNVDTPVSCYRMWIDGKCRCDAMLPFFLHLSMHDQKRVVREMDRYLAFGIGTRVVLGFFIISCHNLSNPEFSCYSEANATNYRTRTKIGELIGVIADTFSTTSVTVDKCCVWLPFFGRLKL